MGAFYITTDGNKLTGSTHFIIESQYKINRISSSINPRLMVSELNYIRCNDNICGFLDEVLIEISNIEPTKDQYNTLMLGLDSLQNYRDHVALEIDMQKSVYYTTTGNEFNFFKLYYFKEYTTDDIIKDIKRYYKGQK